MILQIHDINIDTKYHCYCQLRCLNVNSHLSKLSISAPAAKNRKMGYPIGLAHQPKFSPKRNGAAAMIPKHPRKYRLLMICGIIFIT